MATSSNLITRATRKRALEERGLIRSQMRLGAGLIALGALSIPLFQVSGVLEGQAATAAFAVATAVIGAGAAMLPTGAAAGASARILRSLPGPGHCGRRPAWGPQRPSRQRPGPSRDCSEHRSHGLATPARPVTCPAPCVSSGPTRTTLRAQAGMQATSDTPANKGCGSADAVRTTKSRGGRTGGVAIYSEG
jgi:hypothetical protein